MSTMMIIVDCRQLDAEDQRAVRFVCSQESESRLRSGLEPLDFSTAALRKQFYESYLATMVTGIHAQIIATAAKEIEKAPAFKEVRDAWAEATPEQREAALKALTLTVPG